MYNPHSPKRKAPRAKRTEPARGQILSKALAAKAKRERKNAKRLRDNR